MAVAASFGIQLHGSFEMRAYPELARAVERLPFDELTVHDVVWWRPLWPVLTLVAASTERVRVGPDVTHPLLVHPLVTAASLAALDEMTGGRVVFGVGRGSLLEPVGLEPAQPSEVRQLVADVEGHLRSGFNWRPPRTRLPVFVGAFGPRMIELACAGWAEQVRPPGIWDDGFFSDVRRRVAGRVGLGCEVWTVVDPDRGRARDLGRAVLGRFLPAMRAMTRFYGVDPAERPISDRTLDLFVAAGTPTDIQAGVERLLDAGAESITFSGRLGEDPFWAIDRLGEIAAGLGTRR